jgi:translation elongation factor EF-1alpha
VQNQRVGAMRVNVVCADLQRRGYEVFREDGLCSCDVVASWDGELIRVEVKGQKKHIPRGNIIGAMEKRLNCRKFDVLAVVANTAEGFNVRYIHSLAHRHNVASCMLTGMDEYPRKTTKKYLARAAQFSKGAQ